MRNHERVGARLAARLGLLCIGLILPLLAAEILLRVWYAGSDRPLYTRFPRRDEEFMNTWIMWREAAKTENIAGYCQYDSALGWRNLPNLDRFVSEDRPPVSTNSLGMRGRREFTADKTPGTVRIACVGDSFVFGYDSPDTEFWIPLAEAQLANAEMLNFGVVGYGMDQQLLLLEQEVFEFDPDIIVVGCFEDDAERNMYLFRNYAKPRFILNASGALELINVPVPPPAEILARRRDQKPVSYIGHFVAEGIRSKDILQSGQIARYDGEKARLARAIIRRFDDAADRASARLLFVYIPLQWKYEPDDSDLRRDLLALSKELGFEVLDLADELARLNEADSRNPWASHFNAYGNLRVADMLRKKLVSLGWAEARPGYTDENFDERLGRIASTAIEDERTLLGEANAARERGRLEEAVALYQKILDHTPGDSWIHAELGFTYHMMNRLGEAQESYLDALALRPESPEINQRYGLLLYSLGDPSKACSHFREAIRLRPRYVEPRLEIARFHIARREFATAHELLKEALDIAPEHPRAHLMLGMAHEQEGHAELAKGEYESAVRLDPDLAEAHAGFGVMLAQLGDLAGAERELKEAVRLAPGDADTHNNLGILFARMSRMEEASASFQAALDINPNHSEAARNLRRARSSSR